MRIILIGGKGFLGGMTREAFERAGIDCVSVGRNNSNDFHADLMDFGSIAYMLLALKPDLVVNFAGAFEGENSGDLLVNSEGPKNLVSAIGRFFNNTKLVHISSATEPSDPNYPYKFESRYSQSKYMGTQTVYDATKAEYVQAKIVRVHNCYGVGQPQNRFVSWVINQAKLNEPVHLNYPSRVRDFCLVSEAALSISNISTTFLLGASNDTEEVGTGIGISLKDVAFEICDALDVDRSLIRKPKVKEVDFHPTEIANLSDQASGLCSTTFKTGITDLLGGN